MFEKTREVLGNLRNCFFSWITAWYLGKFKIVIDMDKIKIRDEVMKTGDPISLKAFIY